MKKVFVFLSVFALTIALIGFSAKNSTKSYAAGELFTEDPTISENEIPMYIMNSIYTTFPNDYNYAEAGDDQWGGAARMYPWNETRLQVKLVDDNGFTGKEYAIFFSGSTSATNSGTGNNLLFFALNPNTNKVEIARKDASSGNKLKYASDGAGLAMDPSLSHLRTNISGQDIVFDAYDMYGGDDQGNALYTRSVVFDGEGRMIYGIAPDTAYARNSALTNKLTPEYCFADGEVVKVEDGVVCDNFIEETTDPDTGEIVETPTEEPNYVYDRYVFRWVSAEEFASEDFVGVNEVAYLSEGWDAQKWDYATYEEESDGYVCIAFVRGAQSAYANSYTLTEAQLAVYTETCAANGLEAPTAATKRDFARQIYVPNGGMVYDFGYLDNQVNAAVDNFVKIFEMGYKYGRHVEEVGVDAEGNPIMQGMGYGKTVDFSAAPLYYNDNVTNGYSYQLMDGQNTIEVMVGEKFKPTNGLVYTGMSKYWAVPNDFTSFQADTSVLDMYVVVDGVTQVAPSTGYSSFEALKEDFMKDVNAFVAKKQGFTEQEDGTFAKPDGSVYTPVPAPAKMADGATQEDAKAALGGTTGVWYTTLNNELGSNGTYASFLLDDAMFAKWSWLYEYMNTKLAAASAIDLNKRTVPSPGNYTYAVWAFLAESPEITGWPASKADFSNGNARGWLDERTNLEKWQQLEIDTALDNVDKSYLVEYRVKNTVTNNESTFTIRYQVVDEYTPILKVNKDALLLSPTLVDGKAVMPVVDPYTFTTAYNARYNGKTILGDDISYKVHYSSETLDFANPTEGSHVVTAKVYNVTKYVEKSFTVKIEDMTAPIVKVYSDMVIGVGEVFLPSTAVYYAYDAVDGNLLAGNVRDWVDYSGKAPDTSKPGEYKVGLIVSDYAGNTFETTVNVTVIGSGAADDKLDEIAGAIDEQGVVINAQLAEIKDLLQADSGSSSCAMPAAALIQLVAASSLLVVFLRKRH